MKYNITDWLPTTVDEMRTLGWDRPDVILFTGDAYVDHPSFGAAMVGRLMQSEGLRVAIVPQPNWRDDLRDFRKFGRPRLFFAATAGNMDSMVNHYTANKRLRSDDAYTPGGKAGFRPDRALTVYSRIIKELYPDVPLVVGGIEASLRRLAHYDYWSDAVMPSVLADTGADVLMYGMGDVAVPRLAAAVRGGFDLQRVRQLPQMAYMTSDTSHIPADEAILLESFENCVADGRAFGRNFVEIETESNRLRPVKYIIEPTGEGYVVVNPPYPGASQPDVDRPFELPYTRLPHPRYRKKGAIPAFAMIRNSVTLHRGCFGGCSFCTISAHQGKFIASRSEKSVRREIDRIIATEGFDGVITDLGGPSANMYGMKGRQGELCERCVRPSCLYPAPCRNLDRNHSRLLDLYRTVRETEGIKRVFIGSGIRYDLFEGPDGKRYLSEVVRHHVSGRLKVAPEHTEPHVLSVMRKPPFEMYQRLTVDFKSICHSEGLKYQIVPYFISSHPGCRLDDMKQLYSKTSKLGLQLEQVQDFTPTPMTLASVMFHTGMDPYTAKPVAVDKDQDSKKLQKSWFFSSEPKVRSGEGKNKGGKVYPRSAGSGRGKVSVSKKR